MIKLRAAIGEYYTVKEGDDVESISRAANASGAALRKLNGLAEGEEPRAGIILRLPPEGDLYTVQPGDDIETLCGSAERFEALNGTKIIFPGMKVRI